MSTVKKEAEQITKPLKAEKDDGPSVGKENSDGMTNRCPINFAGASHFTVNINYNY